MKIRKAIIPAAGLGTRFLPATKAMPKEMLPIVDKPVIQYIVEEAVASGIEDIIIVTGKHKRAIEDHFDCSFELEENLKKNGKLQLLEEVKYPSRISDIHYIRQKEPLGLGHAIWCARKFIGNEPFAVLLADDLIQSRIPVLKQMVDQYEKIQSPIIAFEEVPVDRARHYGIVESYNQEGVLFPINSVIEKPERPPSNLAIVGRYILDPYIFDLIEKLSFEGNGEIQLTPAINDLHQAKPVWAYRFDGQRYDIGDKWGHLQAIIDFALQRDDLKNSLMEHMYKRLIAKKENSIS